MDTIIKHRLSDLSHDLSGRLQSGESQRWNQFQALLGLFVTKNALSSPGAIV